MRPLAPIVTNFGNPPDFSSGCRRRSFLSRIRPESAALITKIGDDVVAYLRTVSIAEIQGPTGFQFLREDLKKRAIQLGGGKVRDFLLTNFVVE